MSHFFFILRLVVCRTDGVYLVEPGAVLPAVPVLLVDADIYVHAGAGLAERQGYLKSVEA